MLEEKRQTGKGEKAKEQKSKFHKKEPFFSKWTKRVALATALTTAGLLLAPKSADAKEEVEKDYKQRPGPVPKLKSLDQLGSGMVVLELGADWCEACKYTETELSLLYDYSEGAVEVYTLSVERPLCGDLEARYEVPHGAVSHNANASTLLFFKDGKFMGASYPLDFIGFLSACRTHFEIHTGDKEDFRYYLEMRSGIKDEEWFMNILSTINRLNQEYPDDKIQINLNTLKKYLETDNRGIQENMIKYLAINGEKIKWDTEKAKKFVSFILKNHDCLSDTDVVSRALGNIGEPAVGPLLDSIKSKYKKTNKDVFLSSINIMVSPEFYALRYMGDSIIEPMADALDDKNIIVKLTAVSLLGGIANMPIWSTLVFGDDEIITQKPGNYEAIDALIHALDDENKEIRILATYYLATVESIEAYSAFEKKLMDPDPVTRKIIVSMLWRSANPNIMGLFATALNDENEDVRAIAVATLGYFNEEYYPMVVPLLIKASNDKSEYVRAEVACALLNFMDVDADAKNAVIEMAESEDSWVVRHSIAYKLSDLELEPSTVDSLIKILVEDEHWGVRKAAVMSAGFLDTPDSAMNVIYALNDSNVEVRLQALEAVGELCNIFVEGSCSSLDDAYRKNLKMQLIKTSQDKNKKVRKKAKELLDYLTDVDMNDLI